MTGRPASKVVVVIGGRRLDGAFNNAGGGSIVNNASIGGVRGIPGMPGYTAAKHGAVGLSRSAALENAGRGDEAAVITGAALAIDGGATA